MVLPSVNWNLYPSTAAANQTLNLNSTSASCPWNATSDSQWLRVQNTSGFGASVLRFDVAAHTGDQFRQTNMRINGATSTLVQYGSSQIVTRFVNLRPSESVLSHLGGEGVMTFLYSLARTVPAIPVEPWLRVTDIVLGADKREVNYFALPNLDPEPRTGTILVGGKPFTILQLGAPPPSQ